MKPLLADDQLLRKPCDEVPRRELRTKQLQELIEDMLNFVYGKANKGKDRDIHRPSTVGLSANQIGVNKKICVVDMAISSKGFHDLHVLINPKIVWQSKTLQRSREGCVNLLKTWGYIDRHKRIIVEALDRSGNILRIDAKGDTARLLQHEIDHLNGILYIDHLADPSKAHLVEPDETKAHKKAGENWHKYIDVSHLVRRRSIS